MDKTFANRMCSETQYAFDFFFLLTWECFLWYLLITPSLCACGLHAWVSRYTYLNEVGQADVDTASLFWDLYIAYGDVRHDGEQQRLQHLLEWIWEPLRSRHLWEANKAFGWISYLYFEKCSERLFAYSRYSITKPFNSQL